MLERCAQDISLLAMLCKRSTFVRFFCAPLLPFPLARMGACYSRVALDIRVRMLTCLGSPAIVEVAAIH